MLTTCEHGDGKRVGSRKKVHSATSVSSSQRKDRGVLLDLMTNGVEKVRFVVCGIRSGFVCCHQYLLPVRLQTKHNRQIRQINQSINCYFFVHLNVDQRAGQLSLLHVGITKTDGKMKSSKSACWVICPTSGTDILFVGHQPSTSWSCTTMDMGSVCRTVDGVAQG